ncbi:lysostaphin resistance A-like protein [Microbacterium sp. YY-01]|uniref:CPBP family intramembrane glutamic endopeptidase n=1 Tax=Microbacterium sp. YY-01 TaxID=3421634 RepID=UPI003D16EF64
MTTAPKPAAAATPAPTHRIPLAATVTFVVLACGLAWLFALPLWLGEGLAHPLAGLIIPAIMATPALAVVITLWVLKPLPRGTRLSTLGMWPLRPVRRVVGMSAIALIAPVVIIILSTAVAAASGWLTVDLVHLSGFTELLQQQTPEGVPVPPAWIVVASQLISIPIAAATINAVLAFGEELGWRGFLLPALRPYGTWPALIVSGIIWGLWHTPVILLGYNFNRTDASGVLLMVAGCTVWGILLGWLRLRTASVWPAVFAHGALNAAAALYLWFFAAGTQPDAAWVSVLGVSGWIVGGAVVIVLALSGQMKKQPALGAPRR